MPPSESMPRFTIRHLLLWTACSCFLAWRSTVPVSIALTLSVTIIGGALTVSAIVIYTCVRHSLWMRTEPGHWFAFVAAWEYVDMIVVTPTCVSVLPIRKEYIYCIAFLGMAAIYIVGAIIGRWEWYWRVAISLLALDAISAAGWRLTQEWWGWPGVSEFTRNKVTPAIAVAAVLVTLGSIGADLYGKRYRDWLHWCGIPWLLLKWYGLAHAYVIPYFYPPQLQGGMFG